MLRTNQQKNEILFPRFKRMGVCVIRDKVKYVYGFVISCSKAYYCVKKRKYFCATPMYTQFIRRDMTKEMRTKVT